MNIKELWRKNTKGWKGTVVYIVLGFVIALAVNNILAFTLNTDMPVVAVFSNSMVPTFSKGDMLFVRNYMGEEKPEIGDIVIFDTPNFPYPIIHRIIEINDDQIQTKGDNNPVQDPWTITEKSIHGKSIFIVPVLGWVKVTAFSIFGV